MLRWCSNGLGTIWDHWKTRSVQVSSTHMSFLDIEVFKDERFYKSGQLNYKLFRKPTNQAVPLGRGSMHHDSIHKSWPLAELGRIAKRSGNPKVFSDAVANTVNRWHLHDLDFDLSSMCQRSFYNAKHSNVSLTSPSKQSRICWLVMPYHDSFHLARVRRTLCAFLAKWKTVIDGLGGFDIKISSKSFFPNLLGRFRRHNCCLVRWEWMEEGYVFLFKYA